MNLTELKNENGSLSGIMIPAADLSEIKSTVRKGTSFYHYLEKLILGQNESIGAPVILTNGLTVENTNRRSAERTEQLYRHAFEQGVSMFYTDNRCKIPDEFIKANPDGSEDLVFYDLEKENHKVLKHLLPPGKGQWSYLVPNTSNEATVHHHRGAEWGR